MQLKINNRANPRSKFVQVLLLQFNVFKEFKIIGKYLSRCVNNPNFVCTNLSVYFRLYSIWFFIWKKFCMLYGFKKNLSFFWKLRDYFLSNKFKKSTLIYKNLCFSAITINLKRLQNLFLENFILFFIEPLFDIGFKSFSFGYRPHDTVQLALQFLIQKIKKDKLIWILSGTLDLFLQNLNCDLFFSLLLKRIWDPFLLSIIKSWILIHNSFFLFTKNIIVLGVNSTSLFNGFLYNIYFDFVDNIFLTLLFIYKKKENFQKSKFFNYNFFLNTFESVKRKYVFCFCLFFYFKSQFYLGCVKYIRIYNTVFFCTNSTFYFILWWKEKCIYYLQSKIFLSMKYLNNLKIKNLFQGFSFYGFCLKKSFSYIDLYIEKRAVIQYLKFKGFCNKIGFPISCIKYIGWTQININLKINFLIQLLNLWWFKGKNKKKMVFFMLYIIRYSISKLYANKYKKTSVSKVFNVGGVNFNIGIKSSL
jgi:hypothetical protein